MPISEMAGVQLNVPVTGVQTQEELKVAPGNAAATLEFMVILSPFGSVAVISNCKFSPGHNSMVIESTSTPPLILDIGGELKLGCWFVQFCTMICNSLDEIPINTPLRYSSTNILTTPICALSGVKQNWPLTGSNVQGTEEVKGSETV